MREPGCDLPFVTVVMPVRNEAGFIARSLASVLAQDYPHDRMEVVIADGMSEDGTREVLRGVIDGGSAPGSGAPIASAPPSASGPEVILVDNPGRIAPTGMNAALRRARGSIIVRVDGHAVLEPDYIRQCVECLRTSGATCVGGGVESLGEGYVGEAIAAAMSSPFGVGGSGFRIRGSGAPVVTDTVPFGAFRREVFDRVGLFNERMVRHQDYEFNYRLRKAGGTILLLPSARVHYYVRSTLPRLWRQYWQYGVWKGRFLRAHPDSLKPRHLLPPLFMLVLALGLLLAFFQRVGLWALTALLGAYVGYLLVATARMALRGKSRYAPVLPAVMVCLHFGYGLGCWVGLLTPIRDAASRPAPSG